MGVVVFFMSASFGEIEVVLLSLHRKFKNGFKGEYEGASASARTIMQLQSCFVAQNGVPAHCPLRLFSICISKSFKALYFL